MLPRSSAGFGGLIGRSYPLLHLCPRGCARHLRIARRLRDRVRIVIVIDAEPPHGHRRLRERKRREPQVTLSTVVATKSAEVSVALAKL